MATRFPARQTPLIRVRRYDEFHRLSHLDCSSWHGLSWSASLTIPSFIHIKINRGNLPIRCRIQHILFRFLHQLLRISDQTERMTVGFAGQPHIILPNIVTTESEW